MPTGAAYPPLAGPATAAPGAAATPPPPAPPPREAPGRPPVPPQAPRGSVPSAGGASDGRARRGGDLTDEFSSGAVDLRRLGEPDVDAGRDQTGDGCEVGAHPGDAPVGLCAGQRAVELEP